MMCFICLSFHFHYWENEMKDNVFATLFVHVFHSNKISYLYCYKMSEICCLLLHFELNESKQETRFSVSHSHRYKIVSVYFGFIVND